MMSPLQSSPPQFSGRTELSSFMSEVAGFHEVETLGLKSGEPLFKSGDIFIEETTTNPEETIELAAKTLVSIEPHQGQSDSKGFSVPDNTLKDCVDLVTFSDSETGKEEKVLVGSFEIFEKDRRHSFSFQGLDTEGKPVDKTNTTAINILKKEIFYHPLNKFLKLIQNEMNQLRIKASQH